MRRCYHRLSEVVPVVLNPVFTLSHSPPRLDCISLLSLAHSRPLSLPISSASLLVPLTSSPISPRSHCAYFASLLFASSSSPPPLRPLPPSHLAATLPLPSSTMYIVTPSPFANPPTFLSLFSLKYKSEQIVSTMNFHIEFRNLFNGS